MRDSADPSRSAPMRRLAVLGLVFVAAILSCGKDVTGPLGSAARYVRGLSWNAVFPPAFQLAGGTSSGVVPFNRVHVVLHHTDGTVALDTIIDFPPGADSLTLSLTVKLLDNAPSGGEPMTLDLGYLDAAGDTVFKGGPISITAAPPPSGGGSNPPVVVPVSYTGPGSSATSVVISPRTSTVASGSGFSFSAVAKDNNGVALAGTPIIWSSLDPLIATITSAAAGQGVAQSQRGTARIIAQLITGPADTVQVLVLLPASQIIAQSGNAQTGVVGTQLAQPLVVKVAASDGVGIAGTTVNFAVAGGGGSVASASAVSDANGLAQTTWKLGPGTGAQSVTASSGTLTNSPLTFTATAQPATATKLVVTTQPVNGVAGTALTPIVVTAEDNNGNVSTAFTGPVAVAFGTNTSGATLGGTTTVNAVAGIATFSVLTVNKNGSAYTLVASSTGLTSATTGAFDIAVSAPSKLAFTVQPVNAVANVAIAPAIVVNAQDSQGNPTPSFTGAVVLGLATDPTGATLGGTLTANAVAGVATFAGVTVSLTGNGYVLSASSTGLTGASSLPFNVGVGLATTLSLVSGGGQIAAASSALPQPIVVRVTDAGGNSVAGVALTFGVVTGGGSVNPPSVATNAQGQASTNWTLGALVGAETISATGVGLAGSPLTISATATVTFANANLIWTGATSNAWTTASNWNAAHVPTANDSVYIPAGGTQPSVTTSISVKHLYVASGATITNTGTIIVGGNLDAGNTILGGGIVSLVGVNSTLKGTINGTVGVFNTYTIAGATAITGSLMVNPGRLTLNGNTVNVTGAFTTGGGGLLVMQNVADVLNVSGAASFGGGSETGLLTAGNLNVGGSFMQFVSASSFDASGTHTTTLNGATAQTLAMSAPLTSRFQNVTFANPAGTTLQSNFTALGNVHLLNGSVSGATVQVTIAGTLMDSLGGFQPAQGIIFNGGPTPVSALTSTINGPVSFNANPSILQANLMVNGAVIVQGNLQLNSHYLVVNGTFTTLANGQLTMTNAGDSAYVSGNATFGGGSEAGILTNGKLKLNGNFSQANNDGGQEFQAVAPHLTVLVGSNSQTISFANPDTVQLGANCTWSCFGSLTINKTDGSVTYLSPARHNGKFRVLSATPVTAVGTVGNQRFIIVHDSTISAATAPVTFGRFATMGNIAFGASAVVDTIGFYGNATQVIPAGTYGFLFIGDGATPTLGGNINTTSDLDIKGTFTVGGNTVHIAGIFQTLGSTGVLVMNNASDNVQAAGVVNFYGGAESGSLTAGTLSVGAAFNQNVTPNSFDASGTHTVVFNGSAFNGINIANPFTSRFQNVTVSTVGGMGLGASNSVTVLGNLVLNTGLGGAPVSTITIGGTLTDPGGLLGVGNVTFTGSAPISASTPAVSAFGANGIVFSGAATLAGPVTFNLNGAVSVSGGLTLAGYITHVNGNFSTTGTGTLTMTNALDSLIVKQNAKFDGGSEVGLLTRGALVVSSFTQSGPSATSFAADSTHKTYLLSLVPVGISFANPGTGAGASHFGTLIVETGNNIVLQSDVYVDGALVMATANPQFFIVAGPAATPRLLVSRGANVRKLIFNNVRWLLLDGSATTKLDTVTFENITNNTATQFEVQRNGQGSFAPLRNWSFSTVPTGLGLYIKATDTDGIAPFLTLTMSGTTPGITGGFTSALNGAVISGWSTIATWTGAVSTDWNVAGNWSNGTVPTPLTDVLIPSGTPNSPSSISTIANAHNLTVSAGATVTAGGSGSSNITAQGTLTIVPGGAINLNGSGVVAFGDVIADTAGAGAVTGCAGGMALNLQSGAHNVKGRFCNLSIFGNYTATGPIVVDTVPGSPGTTGILNMLNPGSNLTLSGNRVFVRSLVGGSAGNGTLTMTNSNDSLIVTGNATFNGAASTGLMTAGNLVVGGNLNVTGQSLDAGGTHTTTLNSATNPQTISFGSTMAGHGLNNLTFRGAGLKNFGANANVLGNVLIAASVTSQVSGPVTVRLGGAALTDSTAVVAGAWGVGLTFFTSAPVSLPAKMPGNNVQFNTGTTTLSQSLSANNITIDGASTSLKLNGNYLTTNGNNFTTQNGATIDMTTAGDSLAVGAANFGGGSEVGLLTRGALVVSNFTQSGPTLTSFAADSTHKTYLLSGAPVSVNFANPGTGAAASHFGTLIVETGSNIVLQSDVWVDGALVMATANPQFNFVTSPPATPRLLVSRGANVRHLQFFGVRWLLLDGSATTKLDTVVFTLMDPTVAQFEVQRSGTLAMPNLNNWTFSTTPTSGQYVRATDTDGLAPFLTLNFVQQSPTTNGGFIAALGNAIIIWPAGPATHLFFNIQPSTTVAGGNITPAIVVQAQDAGNALATSFSGNVTLAFGANPGASMLSGALTVAAVAGVATFNNISLNKPAIGYTLSAGANGLGGVTSSAFNVTAGPLATIMVSPNPSNLGISGTQQFTAIGKDASGNVVAITPTWSVVASGGTISSTGLFTAGSTPGTFTNTVTATSGAISGTATVTVTITFASLTAGFNHTCGRTAGNAAYCWGLNSNGELGDGTTTSRSTPTLVAGGFSFTSLTAGQPQTCGLTSAGAAYCWGNNFYGELGDGTSTQRLTPTPVSGGLVFASLTGGQYYNCGLTAAGVAYCWGLNGNGALGDGTTNNHSTPTLVAGGLLFSSLAAGDQSTCGLTAAGAAYCWGYNGYGELGDGTTTLRLLPTPVTGGLVFASLSASKYFSTCGLTTGVMGGAAYCWGNNAYGQTGDGTTTSHHIPTQVTGGLVFTSLAVGFYDNCGLTAGGVAYCWGQNFYGEVGDGTVATQRNNPTLVSGGVAFANLTAGSYQTCGLTAGGAAYCWGLNGDGELGDGTITNRSVPTPVIP